MNQTPGNPLKIAVIGGGISGLAAAHRIGELDPTAKVTLFEASDRLGGIIRTVRQDGFLIEQSADSFITNSPWAISLCRRIGLADELIPTNPQYRGAMVLARGKLQRVPDGFVLMSPNRIWPTLRSPILSFRGKLRLMGERFVKPRTDGNDESVADFARRRLGRETFERLVQPLVGGIYTADPEKLSMAAALPRFVEMERTHGSLARAVNGVRQADNSEKNDSEQTDLAESGARYSLFMTPRDGLSSLIEKIAGRLPKDCVQLNSTVGRIERIGEKWRLIFVDEKFPSQQFDAVILATPTPTTGKLLGGFDENLAGELAGIDYASSAIVVLGYDRSQISNPLDSFGFVGPAIERRRILSASFSSVKFPCRAPEGKVLIRVFLGGALQSEVLELTDDRLREIAAEELRDLLGVSGGPCLSMVFRWPAAMPQYHLGHLERLAQINQRLAKLSCLALAGNAFEGVGIPQCIRSGEHAAEKILTVKM